jgi:hypothetical protein
VPRAQASSLTPFAVIIAARRARQHWIFEMPMDGSKPKDFEKM